MSSLDISQRKHIWPENESLQKHQEHQDLVSPRKKCAASFQQTNPPFANVTSGVVWKKNLEQTTRHITTKQDLV